MSSLRRAASSCPSLARFALCADEASHLLRLLVLGRLEFGETSLFRGERLGDLGLVLFVPHAPRRMVGGVLLGEALRFGVTRSLLGSSVASSLRIWGRAGARRARLVGEGGIRRGGGMARLVGDGKGRVDKETRENE